MNAKNCLLAAAVVTLLGCGSSESPVEPQAEPQPRPTVFDPLTSTIGRAQGVQQTVDDQAAEQRRRIEEAER
jgi:hypothetical protein